MKDLKGLGVSPGIARGEALVLRQRARHRYYLVPASAVEQELERLEQARETSRAQLEEISARITRLAGAASASLFEAQILMLDRAGGDEIVTVPRALAQHERLAARDPGRDAQALQVVHVSLITSTPPLR